MNHSGEEVPIVRVVAVVLLFLTPLTACGSGADSDSNSADGLTAEQEALVEELQELATDDEEAFEEGLEEAAERSSAAAVAAVAIDLSPCDLVTATNLKSPRKDGFKNSPSRISCI